VSRLATVILLAAWLTQGCAGAGSVPPKATAPQGSSAIHWVNGPQAGISSLVMQPMPLGSISTIEGDGEALVSMGAFFTQWLNADSRLDQLALMVQVVGDDPEAGLGQARELLLEADGELFSGSPTESVNSYRVDETPMGTRVTLVIAVDPDCLQRLIDAKSVHGILGDWEPFEVPPIVRAGFDELLASIPSNSNLDWDRTAARGLIATQ
jgi:hypothetical protein